MKYCHNHVTIKVRPNDTIDTIIRKLSKKIKKENVLTEWFERQFYMKPSEKRKMKKRKQLQTIKKMQQKEK